MRDDALRDAFRSLADGVGGECSAGDLERVWLAVSGELAAPERRALVERMATEPALAEAWRVAQELWRVSQDGVAPETAGCGRSDGGRFAAAAAGPGGDGGVAGICRSHGR